MRAKTVYLLAPDGPAQTIVDCYAEDDTLQHRHFNVVESSYLRISSLSLLYGGTDLVEHGGCILVSEGSTLNIVDSILSNCRAQYGGAIHASGGAYVVLGGSTQLQANTAVHDGGCVHVHGSTLTVTGRTTLSNCRARSAGGVSASNTMIILRDFVQFDLCRATSLGGAMRIFERSRLSVTGQVAFSNCAAGVNGGALHVSELSSVDIFRLSVITNVRHFTSHVVPFKPDHALNVCACMLINVMYAPAESSSAKRRRHLHRRGLLCIHHGMNGPHSVAAAKLPYI